MTVFKAFRMVGQTGKGQFAYTVLGLLILLAAMSYVWLPHDPNYAQGWNAWLPMSLEHPLGTDGSGRDVASRLIAGTRITVLVAVGTGIVSGVIGVVLATAQTLGPKLLREPLAIFIDVLIAFPTLLMAIMFTAVFTGGIPIVIIAVGVGFGVQIARVVRAEMRQILGADYILAARASGVTGFRLLMRHILPNISSVLTVQISLSMGLAILAESGLSYLGFGAPPGVSSWGRMLEETQRYISIHPEVVFWPGFAITLTVLAFYLLGDALRETLDPKLTKKQVLRRTSLGVQG
ncbi:MAG TPA: ABC transporter permease [Microbacteriaceae bacterium]|nr:ABC transporter permease [Microbacteriaceae bacterium]